MTRGLLVALLFSLLRGSAEAASADEDWQKIAEFDSARVLELDLSGSTATREFDAAEKVLSGFIAAHPDDPRVLDARLRLGSLLAIRAFSSGDAALLKKAKVALEEAASTAPNERKGDVAFTQLSLQLRSPATTTETLWQSLLDFQKAFPDHPRLPDLFVQACAHFDAEPARQKILLERASKNAAADDELRAEIADELKKLALLDHPLALQFTSLAGDPIDIANYRGKIVLVYFFAAWSPPSMTRLTTIQKIAATPGVQCLGVSLDTDAKVLLATIKARKINWPIASESQGWKSPLVRSLGINTLPTCWLVDKRGNLRTLNARGDLKSLLRQLLRE